MDKKIERKFWNRKRVFFLTGGLLLVSLTLWALVFRDKRTQLRVETEKLTVLSVSQGAFNEFIPVNGTVIPIQSVQLDAVEGGSIEKIFKQSGDMVKAGDVILQLSNTELKLNVLTRETALYDQLNNARTSRLQLQQNTLALQNTLAEIDYQVKIKEQQLNRNDKASKYLSEKEMQDVREEVSYQKRRRNVTQRSYMQDSLIRIQQNSQLSQSEKRIWESIQNVGQMLDNLLVKAPISGQLSTATDLQIGQLITKGTKIGQVDILDKFKVRVPIDELYLPRIVKGLEGYADLDGKEYKLVVDKVFPTVTNGRFEVDMLFAQTAPTDIRRGQTLRIRLELGKPEQAVLLPTGGFYQQTGGNWVFVVEAGGQRAVRRNIQLGRKNPTYYEVLDGLKPGEKVITSSYEFFGDNEVLNLNEKQP
ncbi:efflux transporter periplasmic adaptor subunit [Siphonobacter sp. BAB-5385]|uniref:efflux RND transporter periplasmic adaptor subunit n=1 Tax=Siphonobacter sp. BAB-5385 TaxID=1864822 RepID=UPI000B9DE59F|nr:efflux RND transporter periplasmic adaptor subunit [Siphonobacter sp. BAB-5385]OZI06731.1 efflux transporter periplasmic adaptor subunit [Siphonobacter sp. BAB-5385]